MTKKPKMEMHPQGLKFLKHQAERQAAKKARKQAKKP